MNSYLELYLDNQSKLTDDFQFIFDAINTLGQDPNSLIDCSDVIPAPKPQNFGATRFPPGKTNADIEQAVSHEHLLDMQYLTSIFALISALPRRSLSSPPPPAPRPLWLACELYSTVRTSVKI